MTILTKSASVELLLKLAFLQQYFFEKIIITTPFKKKKVT